MPDTRAGAAVRRQQYAQWARLLDSILPPADDQELVTVAAVPGSTLPQLEEQLAAVGVVPVISENRQPGGESLFAILVPAGDAERAGRVVADQRTTGTPAPGEQTR